MSIFDDLFKFEKKSDTDKEAKKFKPVNPIKKVEVTQGDTEYKPQPYKKEAADKVVARIYPQAKALREAVHEKVLNNKTSREELLGIVQDKGSLPFIVSATMLFDTLAMFEVDASTIEGEERLLAMAMIWGYVQEYERLKKERQNES